MDEILTGFVIISIVATSLVGLAGVVWTYLSKNKEKIQNNAANVSAGILKMANTVKTHKHQADIRKLAESIIISETIKSGLKNCREEEIAPIKIQIVEAIKAGNTKKAEALMTIAERFKKLD